MDIKLDIKTWNLTLCVMSETFFSADDVCLLKNYVR